MIFFRQMDSIDMEALKQGYAVPINQQLGWVTRTVESAAKKTLRWAHHQKAKKTEKVLSHALRFNIFNCIPTCCSKESTWKQSLGELIDDPSKLKRAVKWKRFKLEARSL